MLRTRQCRVPFSVPFSRSRVFCPKTRSFCPKSKSGEKHTVNDFEENNRLEVLYYHPGYITPEEFFHRMFISVHRLKRNVKQLTILFNSLDQLSARFPLCAKEDIFVPGIIQTLSGEGISSIFIAVDEPGQPIEQYGLLPMADLILSFYPHQFDYEVYCKHLREAGVIDEDNFQEDVERSTKERKYEEIVLQVVRFAGGRKAGARGLLGLADTGDPLYSKPGLHFTPLSPNFPQGTPTISYRERHLSRYGLAEDIS